MTSKPKKYVYVNIDSTYRDRILYPNPADMVISFANYNDSSNHNTISESSRFYPDPVDAQVAPLIQAYNDASVTNVTYPAPLSGDVLYIDDYRKPLDTVSIIQTPAVVEEIKLPLYDNYFNNMVVELVNDNYFDSVGTTYYPGLDPVQNPSVALYNDPSYQTIQQSFYDPRELLIETNWGRYYIPQVLLVNPTYFDPKKYVYLNYGTSSIDNHYVGKTITFLNGANAGETRNIIAYNGMQRKATLDVLLPNDSQTGFNFTISTPQRWFLVLDNLIETDKGAQGYFPTAPHVLLTNFLWGGFTIYTRYMYTIRRETPISTGMIRLNHTQTQYVVQVPTTTVPVNSILSITNPEQLYLRFYVESVDDGGDLLDPNSVIYFYLFASRPIVTDELVGMRLQYMVESAFGGFGPVGGTIIESIPTSGLANNILPAYKIQPSGELTGVNQATAYSTSLKIYAVVSDGFIYTTPDLMTFTTFTVPNGWSSITYSESLDLFVAVARTGTDRVVTSTDGVTWTHRTPSSDDDWNKVIWIEDLGLFVAVGSSGAGRVMTSPDGITWTGETASQANSWQSVAWSSSLGLMVAVSSDGANRVMTSPNSIAWTNQVSVVSNWQDVTFSEDLTLYVAVSLLSGIQTSPDGINWTVRSSTVAFALSSVVWASGPNLFVAVSSDSITGMGSILSYDGITWVNRSGSTDYYFSPGALAENVIWVPETLKLVAAGRITSLFYPPPNTPTGGVMFSDVPWHQIRVRVQGEIIAGPQVLINSSPYGYVFRKNPNYNKNLLIVRVVNSVTTLYLNGPLVEPLQPYDTYDILHAGTNTPRIDNTLIRSDYEACYLITLDSLILPNLELESGVGGLIAYYPYVYVEFYSNRSRMGQPMVTNNPHASTAIFKIPLYNVVNPSSTPYVRLVTTDMNQYIRFYPGDSYTIRVLLPGGDVFRVKADTIPPNVPNQFVQIYYTFSLVQNKK
jgi:hypothetical protein